MSTSSERDAVERAASLLAGRCERDVSLAPLTTYRVGGAARLFMRAESVDDLLLVSQAVRETGVAALIVGRGSNMLVSDEGFEGLAVTFGEAFATIEFRNERVVAGGFTLLPVLARRTAAAGLTGLEWAVGVPGSVGGAVRMNAGGHGSDIAAVLVSVETIDLRSGEIASTPGSSLGLRFRGSDLPGNAVVLRAAFALAAGDPNRCEQEIAEIVRWRREHQPGGQNAGSVFVNPVPGSLAAGQVIDELGLRGFRIGSAWVSEKHANFIQAAEGGRASDVRAVMEAVRSRVAAARGIELRTEIRLVGFDDAPEGDLR